MKGKYIFYYDSGTSNTRLYVLDHNLEVLHVNKKNVGSKDSAIAGNNRVLIQGMKELYDEAIKEMQFSKEDIASIYASGMVTSPYGLKEVPHLELPLTAQEFANSVVPFFEDTCFNEEILLIPGLKTVNKDFSYVNNMRGEEIEIFGTLDELKSLNKSNIALFFPGSHTHITYIQDDKITDIISNFTGELFYALKTATILSPILKADLNELDEAMVRKGVENLISFGFNRAIYICHAMRIFNEGTEKERFSYAEGVVNGGIRQSLEYYCKHFWKECQTAAVVGDEFMYRLFSIIFEGSEYIKEIIWLPISDKKSYAVEGLKKIISLRRESL